MIESVYFDPAFPVSEIERYEPEGWIVQYPRHYRSSIKYLERLAEAYLSGNLQEPVWVACTAQMTRVDDRVGDGRYFAMTAMCGAKTFPAIVQNFTDAKKPHEQKTLLSEPEEVAAYYTFAPLAVQFQCDYDGNLLRMVPYRNPFAGWEKFPLLPDDAGSRPALDARIVSENAKRTARTTGRIIPTRHPPVEREVARV